MVGLPSTPGVFLLTLTLTFGLTSSLSDLSCPADKYFGRHPSCGMFLRCPPGAPPVPQHCPLGTHWSTNTSTCDWPHLANCEKPLEVEELLDNDETQDEDEVAGGGSGSALRASCPGAEEDTFLSWRLGGLPPPHPDFLPAASASACAALCREEPRCVAWNWRMDFGCNLKQAVVGRRHYPGWTAGLRGACSPALPPSQAGPQPACVTEESRACVFPFTFRGREHKACTRAHSVNGAPWCATLSSAGEAVRWGDCTPGCPVEGGGSTLGLCTGRCGAPGPQANSQGFACYCDSSCSTYGDCCPGQEVQCSDRPPLPDLLTSVFGASAWLEELIRHNNRHHHNKHHHHIAHKLRRDMDQEFKTCGNTATRWTWVAGRWLITTQYFRC